MSVGTVVVYAGGYIFLVFFAVCLATGLYYIAELVEENTRLTRRFINYTIKVVIAVHLLLLFVDRLPLLCIACGLASHVVYYRLLKTFPYISLTSYDFLGSVAGLVMSLAAWTRFFLVDPRSAFVSIEWILGFLLVMVFMVPFCFFISLAANEGGLPGGPGGAYQGIHSRSDGDSIVSRGGRPSRGSLLAILNFLKLKRDEVLPQFSSRLASGRYGANVKSV